MLLLILLLSTLLLLPCRSHSSGKGLRRTQSQVGVRGPLPVRSAPEDAFLRCYHARSELLAMAHCSNTFARLVQHLIFLLPGKIVLLRQFRVSSDSSLAAHWYGPGTSGFRAHCSS